MPTHSWRKRTGIQLAYPFEEKRLSKWEPPYIVQPKYDGDRCRAVPIEEGYLLLSSEENPFYSIPHIQEEVDKLRHTNFELDGELYCHGMPHEQIHGIVSRSVNLHPNHAAVKFHIFDIADEQQVQAARMSALMSLRSVISTMKLEHIVITPFRIAETFDDVMRYYEEFLHSDFEGMIVRHVGATYIRRRSIYMMKFKPKKEDIYDIIGAVEEHSIAGVPKGSLGALVCAGSDGTPFNVGTGFSREDRARLWERVETLVGKQVRVQYQHITTGKGVPRFPVFVEVIEDEVD